MNISCKWVKKLYDKELTKPEMEVLTKGFKFANAPDQVPVELKVAW